MPVTPYIKTPFSDMTGSFLNNQFLGPCGNMEMRAMNCLEAYGEHSAETKCKDYVADMYECASQTKQMLRVLEMKKERERQISSGERKVPYMEGPSSDSYEYPSKLA